MTSQDHNNPKMMVEHNEVATSDEKPQQDSIVAANDDNAYRLTLGKLLAILSFQLGYLSDVFVLQGASSILLQVNADIGPNTNYTWMVTAQIVAAAVMSPLVGRLSDIFGRRNFLILGNAISIIGCAVAATAHNVPTVIGASTLIGLGSSLHQLAWSCLGELVPRRSRGLALGIFQTSLAPAAAFAPIIALALVKHASWRYIYWISFVFNSIAIVLITFFYHPKNQYIKEEGKTRWQQAKSLDWIGFVLLFIGLVLFLLGISFGGSRYPWISPGTLCLIFIGFFALVALGLYESYADLTYPLFPKAIFKNIRGFTVVVVGVFVLGMLYYSTGVLWPQQVQILYTQNPISIGWYASALGLAGTIFGPVAGLMLKKFGHARLLLTLFVGGLCVCSGLQAIVTPGSHIASTLLVCLVGGFVASATVLTTAMIQLGVTHEYIGIATAMAITARSVGGSIATTIYASLLESRAKTNIVTYVAGPLAEAGVAPTSIPAVLEALLTGNARAAILGSLTLEQLGIAAEGIKIAFARSFRVVYLVTLSFGVVGTVCVAFSADVDHLMTGEVDITLDEGAHLKSVTDTGAGHFIKSKDAKEVS